MPGSGDGLAAGGGDVVVETASVFKNLELIGLGMLDGETFFQTVAPIRARFRPDPRVRVELGAVARVDYGADSGWGGADALLRVVVNPTPSTAVVAGTLLPTHPAHQALRDDTVKLRDLSEQGFQFRMDTPRLQGDHPINWRVDKGAVRAEEFEVGTVSRVRAADGRIHPDAQAAWTHAGGQILSSRRVDNFAGLLGASVGLGGSGGPREGILQDLRVGGAALVSAASSKDGPSTGGSGWEVGVGSELRLGRATRLFLDARHFSGDGYAAERADPLYRFGSYRQAGADVVWSVAPGAALEFGAVAQDTGNRLNWTAQFNLTTRTRMFGDALREILK